ncbi:serine hydrolase [Streptomyces cellulosae]|uniref:serine hydrolase n=1 Tax=Streptomyces cellulosae TaxID=1968 RepID=UPI0004C61696|nr:serine hydrolase [Streptomyces cellulosae]
MESSRAARRRAARSTRSRPFPRRPLLSAALASVAVVGATAAGTVYVKAQVHSGTGTVSAAAMPSASESGEAPVEPVADPTAVDHDALLASAMKTLDVEDTAQLSVAVLNLDSGRSATYGDGAFDTASIVKVDILAALLLQAQDAGTHLTAREKSYATTMIENSDNASASALWRDIGEADGLDAANERLGLTDTEGGDGALWGLTQTTAADQLVLLRQVFGDDSELSEVSRAYLRGLMGQIAADQHWGVSAAADGSAWALKNGWLARSTTRLWDINSIGRVTVAGHDCLVAALSKGNSTKARGISLVEGAAKAAVSVFVDDGVSASPSASASSAATAPGVR